MEQRIMITVYLVMRYAGLLKRHTIIFTTAFKIWQKFSLRLLYIPNANINNNKKVVTHRDRHKEREIENLRRRERETETRTLTEIQKDRERESETETREIRDEDTHRKTTKTETDKSTKRKRTSISVHNHFHIYTPPLPPTHHFLDNVLPSRPVPPFPFSLKTSLGRLSLWFLLIRVPHLPPSPSPPHYWMSP